MIKQPLDKNWSVIAIDDPEVPAAIRGRRFDAVVPGCVHTDLLRAGAIVDPYVEQNEKIVQWIGLTDWQYRCAFDADSELFDEDRIDLVFDGLDTVARIELNGRKIGRTENMHHAHRFDVREHLKRGSNELVVTFSSAVTYVRQREKEHGPLPWLNTPDPFAFIRKMACNFGWDWGPTLVTCGMWRPVRLEAWSTVRIESVRPLITHCDRDVARVSVFVDVIGNGTATAELRAPDGSILNSTARSQSIEFEIRNPQRWWPIGHGDQPLYELTVTAGEDRWSGRVGLRSVELDTTPDDFGQRFAIKINGKPIFCRGFNWIPDDCFLDRACTPQRYRRRIEQAIGANANMLRVWGGGVYETDEFYDICDELGVLVWQDCLFACAGYPEEPPYPKLVEDELRYNIPRLSRHPSLVLWNGCNENLWGYHSWEQFKPLHDHTRTWGPGYYLDLIPRLMKELDTSRPYWPASPFSGEWPEVRIGEKMSAGAPPMHWDLEARQFDGPVPENRLGEITATGVHPNDEHSGNKHVWEAWFGEEYRAYRRFRPRFCSEFGFQAPATYATTLRALGPDQMRGDSPNYAHHQRSPAGDRNNQRHLDTFFNSPDPVKQFDDWHYLLQLNQARALQLGVEWFRSLAPICMGTLYWQLNDCWPVTSWSAIDGDGRFKPLYYATRRFYHDNVFTIQPAGDGYKAGDALWFCDINDHDEPGLRELLITRRTFDDEILAEQEISIEIAPRSVKRYELDRAIVTPTDPTREFITVGIPLVAAWYFDVDKHLHYPQPKLDAQLARNESGYRLTIVAQSFIRDLCIFVDRLDPDATISDQLVSLLPGEGFTFDIKTRRELAKSDLIAPPVFQCANRFGRR